MLICMGLMVLEISTFLPIYTDDKRHEEIKAQPERHYCAGQSYIQTAGNLVTCL